MVSLWNIHERRGWLSLGLACTLPACSPSSVSNPVGDRVLAERTNEAASCPVGCEPIDLKTSREEAAERVNYGTPPEEGEGGLPGHIPDTSTTICRYVERSRHYTGCKFSVRTPGNRAHCKMKVETLATKQLATFVMNPSRRCNLDAFPPLLRTQSIDDIEIPSGTLLTEDPTFSPDACPPGRKCKALPIDPLFTKNLETMTVRFPHGFRATHPLRPPNRWYLEGQVPVVTAATSIPAEIEATNRQGQTSAEFDIVVMPASK